MGRPIKAHQSNRSNRPVNRLEPVARELLNLFKFGFEFNRFPPVTGPTGPVNQNWWSAVWVNRSGKKNLGWGRLGGVTRDGNGYPIPEYPTGFTRYKGGYGMNSSPVGMLMGTILYPSGANYPYPRTHG